MLTKILMTIFLGVVVGVVILGLMISQKVSSLISPLAHQGGILGTVQEAVLRRGDNSLLPEAIQSRAPIRQTQEIQEKTNQIIESIQNLPQEELKKVKKQLKEDICEKLLREE